MLLNVWYKMMKKQAKLVMVKLLRTKSLEQNYSIAKFSMKVHIYIYIGRFWGLYKASI